MQPNKTKKELIILVAGSALLIGLWVMRTLPPKNAAFPKNVAANAITADTNQAAAPTILANPVSVLTPKEVIYTGRQNRDPVDNSSVFPEVPPEPAEEVPEPQQETAPDFPVDQFKVSAVLWGSKRPQAIINDNVVGVGEELGGGKITGIDKEGIHINYEGKKVLLQLK